MILYLSAKNASKEYNRLSGIINRNLFPHNSGGYKSQIRVPGRWGSGKNSFFPGWLLRASSHRVVIGEERQRKRHRDRREKSLVFRFMKTLNLLDECSTLRAHLTLMSFSGGSDGKESAHNVRDLGSIPGFGRFPGEGNGKPLQYSCLRNPMDRRVWWAKEHGVPKSWTLLKTQYFGS